jgi:hypothetical protein
VELAAQLIAEVVRRAEAREAHVLAHGDHLLPVEHLQSELVLEQLRQPQDLLRLEALALLDLEEGERPQQQRQRQRAAVRAEWS